MNGTMSATQPARLRDNGRSFAREVEPRSHLADFLRHDLGLTGTHIGCEQRACGACTVLLDGTAVHSCLAGGGPGGDQEALRAGLTAQPTYAIAFPIWRLHPVDSTVLVFR